MLFKLARRNIWRNKRRTLITAASIMFAVMAAVSVSSLQSGVWDNMVNNVVNFYFGYAQVHQEGYWEDQSINKAFAVSDEVKAIQADNPTVKQLVPRVESFALASYESQTFGVLVIGTNPEAEQGMTGLQDRVRKGDYFKAEEDKALVAIGVAEKLKLGVGDTIVLISQGYRGVNAAGKYAISGLVEFGSPELNKQMVYLPLKTAQEFFGAEGLVTSVALDMESRKGLAQMVSNVKSSLPAEEYEVLDYKEMLPELLEAKEMDEASSKIVLWVLYLIIAFGIFGTILMMTKERQYEFGVLTSIGMNRWKLAFSVWMEVVLMGLLGAIMGMLVSLPIVLYLHYNPIRLTGDFASAYENMGLEPLMPMALDASIFWSQAVLIFVITTLLAVYPIWKIMQLKPVEAMRA